MLSYVRGLAYKMGFRPKRTNILFSPSLDLEFAAREAMNNFNWNKLRILPAENLLDNDVNIQSLYDRLLKMNEDLNKENEKLIIENDELRRAINELVRNL